MAAITCLLALLLVRVILASIWECRALDEAHELAAAQMQAGALRSMRQVDDLYEQIRPFALVLLDLRQWRYRSPFEA